MRREFPYRHRRGRGDPVRRDRGAEEQGRHGASLVGRYARRIQRRLGRGGRRGSRRRPRFRQGVELDAGIPRQLRGVERARVFVVLNRVQAPRKLASPKLGRCQTP